MVFTDQSLCKIQFKNILQLFYYRLLRIVGRNPAEKVLQRNMGIELFFLKKTSQEELNNKPLVPSRSHFLFLTLNHVISVPFQM